MIDTNGFRQNVGIIITDGHQKLLWARRLGSQNAWQFPQGGIGDNETPLEAMYRELKEELGIDASDVKLLAESKHWLRYRLPERFLRHDEESGTRCIGQNQKWFLLELVGGDACIKLNETPHPEFDRFRWVTYWYPIKQVIYFKRYVYRQALEEFSGLVFGDQGLVK